MVGCNTMSLRKSRSRVVASWSIWAHLPSARCRRCMCIAKMDWAHVLWGFIAYVPKVRCVEANPRVDFEHIAKWTHLAKGDGCEWMSVEALRDMKWLRGHCELQTGMNNEVWHTTSSTGRWAHQWAQATNVRGNYWVWRDWYGPNWSQLEPTWVN